MADLTVWINNVLLVKIEGPVWYTIYHHLPIVKGHYYTPLLINQPMGIWDIYGFIIHAVEETSTSKSRKQPSKWLG